MSSSTIGMVGPLANLDDTALKGVRRSRFSMHLKTRRVRRWLLVQLVSVPAEETQNETQQEFAHTVEQERLHTHLGKQVNDYRMAQPMQSWM